MHPEIMKNLTVGCESEGSDLPGKTLTQAKGLCWGNPAAIHGMLRPDFLNITVPLQRSPKYESSILVFNK